MIQKVLRPGYRLVMPSPSPSPTLYVVLQQQAEQGWWQEWGSSIIPGLLTMIGSVLASLLVALLALRGVKESAEKNAQALIDAETERARNARDHDEYRWLRGARAMAYFGLIATTRRAVHAAQQVKWFSKPRDPKAAASEYIPFSLEKANRHVEDWNDVTTEAARWMSEVRAVGDYKIADLASRAIGDTSKAIIATGAAVKAHQAGETLYDAKVVARKELKRALKKFRRMVALIRKELGSDNAGVPDPESLAASSTEPQREAEQATEEAAPEA